MQSSAPSASVSKIPLLVAAVLFAAAAVFISSVSATRLDALELACLGACLAAAGACAAIPFARARSATPYPVDLVPLAVPAAAAPNIDYAALAPSIAAAVDARLSAALPAFTAQLAEALAALEEKRRAEVLQAVAENPTLRQIDSDTVPPAAGKPRLGRGLEGLIRGNTPKPSTVNSADITSAPAETDAHTDANASRAACASIACNAKHAD